MGFETVRRRQRHATLKPVRVSVRNNHQGHNLVVILSTNLLEQLGIKRDDRIEVLRGTEGDVSWIKLRVAGSGNRLRQNNNTTQALELFAPAWPGLPHSAFAAEAEFLPDVIDKSLRIKLPFDQKVKHG